MRSACQNFRFHRVFGPSDSNKAVYEDAMQELVQGVMSGVNATAVAYGQSRSGKTFTMAGTGADDSLGMVHLATLDVFQYVVTKLCCFAVLC